LFSEKGGGGEGQGIEEREREGGRVVGTDSSDFSSFFFQTSKSSWSTLRKEALQKAPKKPEVWFRYVDDTFVIWRHRR